MFKTDYSWKIYVPKPVADKLDKYIAGMCITYFDGYSRYSVEGGWQGHGKVYEEPTEIYEVATGCADWVQGSINHIVEFIMKESNEKCVLYTKSPIEMHFVERKADV